MSRLPIYHSFVRSGCADGDSVVSLPLVLRYSVCLGSLLPRSILLPDPGLGNL